MRSLLNLPICAINETCMPFLSPALRETLMEKENLLAKTKKELEDLQEFKVCTMILFSQQRITHAKFL